MRTVRRPATSPLGERVRLDFRPCAATTICCGILTGSHKLEQFDHARQRPFLLFCELFSVDAIRRHTKRFHFFCPHRAAVKKDRLVSEAWPKQLNQWSCWRHNFAAPRGTLPDTTGGKICTGSTQNVMGFSDGRGGEIRTHDPLFPKQVRYQTALRPDATLISHFARSAQW